MIKACTSLTSRQVEQICADSSVVARLGDAFQELTIDFAILSAYEGRSTKISGTFISSKYECLVDWYDAEVGMKGERIVKVDSNHFDICDLQSMNRLQREMAELLSSLSIPAEFSQQALSQISETPTYRTWHGTDSEDDMEPPYPSMNLLAPPPTGTLPSHKATAGSSDAQNLIVIPQIYPTMATNPPQLVKLPCHMFGPQAHCPEFFGRQDILALLDESLLEVGETELVSDVQGHARIGLKTFALCGMAGVGKTQTALEFAHSRRSHFDAILFVQAANTMKTAQSFSRICIELGLIGPGGNAEDQAVYRDSVLQWLSRPTRTLNTTTDSNTDQKTNPPITWLLILDNADDLTVLSEYWPVSGVGSVLITSRDPLAKTRSYIPSARGIDLNPLTLLDAGKLLRNLTGYEHTKEHTEDSLKISRQVGGLPLAIASIAATIIRRDVTFKEFLVLSQNRVTRQALYSECSPEQTKNILATFTIGDLDPTSSCLLRVLASLDPDEIYEGILTTPILSSAATSSTFSLAAFPTTLATYTEARRELIRSSLIRKNNMNITIHRLVQDAVLMAMTPDERSETFRSVVELICQYWPFGINDYNTKRWEKCEMLFPHANHLRSYFEENQDEIKLEDISGRFAHLLMDVGWYILERGSPLEALPFPALAQKLLEAIPFRETIRLAEVEHTKAEIHIYTGNPVQGKLHAERALELCKAAVAPGHRLPQAHNEIAEAQCSLQQYDEAIANCDEAIALYLQQEGHFAHFESSAFARINKAFCLWRKSQHEEASKILAELIDNRRRMHGPNDKFSFKSGLSLVTLGNVRTSQGEFAEALLLYQKGHEQFLATLGPWHFRVAGVLFYLAEHADRAGEWADARDKLLQSLKIYSQKSFYKAEMSRTWFKLAEVQQKLNSNTDAEEATKQGNLLLAELSRAENRVVEKGELESFIQYWAL